jgi:hypothetical protein
MADNVPAKLKGLQLAPFAKRAAQLEKFKPIITYWRRYKLSHVLPYTDNIVRFHIVQKIIASGLHSADQECTAYTTHLMEKLEQAKAQNPDEDALLDDVAASAYCEQFALQTFAKGDKDMTENKATKCVEQERLAILNTDLLQQYGRYTTRSCYLPRDPHDMEEGRPRGHIKDKIRKIPRPAHTESHQGWRGPESHEPSQGAGRRCIVPLSARPERPRSSEHKPERFAATATKSISAIRRDSAKHERAALTSLLGAQGLTSSYTAFCPDGLHS